MEIASDFRVAIIYSYESMLNPLDGAVLYRLVWLRLTLTDLLPVNKSKLMYKSSPKLALSIGKNISAHYG